METAQPNETSNWIQKFYDPISGLGSFSSGVDLVDLYGNGTNNLVVADVGVDFKEIKLKVLKDVSVIQEHSIIDVPTGLVSVYMDSNEPRIPGVVVGAGSSLFIYKNLRPFYKYNLPLLKVNAEEAKLWHQANEREIDFEALKKQLSLLCDQGEPLTVQSLNYMDLEDKESCCQFIEDNQSRNIKRETVVTCMSTLNKSMSETDSISCVVVGTENKEILIIDSEAFTLLHTFTLSGIPCFLNVTGIYDVGFSVFAACRNGRVYTCKKDSPDSKLCFEVSSQIVGFERIHKHLVVAKMDKSLSCFSGKGRCLWSVDLPGNVTCTTLMDHKGKGFKAVMVGIDTGNVLVYHNNNLVDNVNLQGVPQALCFGKYGVENSCLIAVLTSGAVEVLVLKHSTEYADKGINQGPPASQRVKLEIPKKSQLYVDQTVRERNNYTDMFQNFQYDLRQMRLTAAKNYYKTLSLKVTPLSDDPLMPLSLTANIFGIGPQFKMLINLVNTAKASAQDPKLACKLMLIFKYPQDIYEITPRIFHLPALVPEQVYNLSVAISSLNNETPVQENVTAFICKQGCSKPVVTAIISMPISGGGT